MADELDSCRRHHWASFAIACFLFAKRHRRRPGDLGAAYRPLFYALLISACLLTALWASVNRHVPVPCPVDKHIPVPLAYWHMLLVPWLAVLVSADLAFMRRRTDRDFATNYEKDPGHCGRCAYDLTGNESGICPECGWRPAGPSDPLESAKWGMWWREWRIPHLYNWRNSLYATLVPAIALAALAAYFMWHVSLGVMRDVNLGMAVMLVLLVIHMLINSVRVIDYARRQRASSCATGSNGNGDGHETEKPSDGA